METNEKIAVKELYKIFGPEPKKALAMLRQGMDKAEVLEKTGMNVGVNNASFSIMSGEIFVIMGLSGSGKSTLVRMLNRLIEPTAGQVLVDGENVSDMSNEELVKLRRRNMSMVFQSFALMPHLNVVQNVAFGLEISGVEKSKRTDRAMDALAQVGLESYHACFPDELSGGMRQRVGLARGLAVNPDIILMDEAFSALDPLIRTEMQDELLKLQSQQQRTIVFISHDLDEAMRIGDRIAIMEGGRIVQVGAPEDILQNPADDYVKAFFRGVDPTSILTAGDVMRDTQVTIIKRSGDGPRTALEKLNRSDRELGYVLDTKKNFLGIVSTDTLKELIDKKGAEAKDMSEAFFDNVNAVNNTDSMQDILAEVASKYWPVPVLDEQGRYQGAISKNIFLRSLQRDQ